VNDLVLIRKNLFRKKLRAILMIVSILIAFAIFGVLAGFEARLQCRAGIVRKSTVWSWSTRSTSPSRCQSPTTNRVAAMDGVRQVTHLNWFGGYYQDPKNFLIVMAVQPETYTSLYDKRLSCTPPRRRRRSSASGPAHWSASG